MISAVTVRILTETVGQDDFGSLNCEVTKNYNKMQNAERANYEEQQIN